MFRRTFVVFVSVILVAVCLSACATTLQPKSSNPDDYAIPDGFKPVATVTTAPDSVPPVTENALVVVSTPIDTSRFIQPATVAGWELSEDLASVVVTIQLSKDDWASFVKQAELDESIKPLQVQMGDETARSLIDLNKLADEIIRFREGRDVSPVDIRSIQIFYDMVVSGL